MAMSFMNQSTRPLLDLEVEYDTKALTVECYILTAMLSVFAIVGSIGNSLVIMVFRGLKKNATSRLFIMALAVIDLFTCVVIIPLTIVFELTHHQLLYDIFCKVYHFLITSQIPFSALIMVAIACERYLCICHSIMTIRTLMWTKITLVCLTVLTVVLGIIPTLGFGVYQVVPEVDDDILDELPADFDFWQLKNMSEVFGEDQIFNETLPYKLLCIYLTNNISDCDSYYYVNFPEHIIYYETCRPTEILISFSTLYIYQRIHSLLFAPCFLMVLVIYGMIYRFMSKRRSDKLKRKLSVCARIRGDRIKITIISTDKGNMNDNTDNTSENKTNTVSVSMSSVSHNVSDTMNSLTSSSTSNLHNTPENVASNTLLETDTGESPAKSNYLRTLISRLSLNSFNCYTHRKHKSLNSSLKSNSSVTLARKVSPDLSSSLTARSNSCLYGSNDKHPSKKKVSTKRTSVIRLIAKTRSANIKTAVMLGVVAVVFFVAFFPAWLMALGIVPIQIVVFYLYFVHNIANPFVYAFMNPAFRQRLGTMITSWGNKISRTLLYRYGNTEP